LTAEWNLLDTDSAEEEFDGSWKLRATAKRNLSQCGNREQVGSAGRECSSRDRKGDPGTAGMIPNWKIVEQQLDAMMGGKQTREKVTRNSEH
jgi:hypothetical protein